MESVIRAQAYVALRLPSDSLRIIQIIPDTPFFNTYELSDHVDDKTGQMSTRLRIVSPSELHGEIDFASPEGQEDEDENVASMPDLPADEALVVKNNRLTVDDASRQTLTMREIEALKGSVTGSGREVIEKIMSAHKNLDEKTEFSLAKYSLRKAKKFLRRFQVLPVDTARLMEWMSISRESSRIMELREETMGLITAWSNVHHTPETLPNLREGRWLVLDDTSGLLVAALAEKMGLLYSEDRDGGTAAGARGAAATDSESGDEAMPDAIAADDAPQTPKQRKPTYTKLATSNTITLVHPASQPNLSILKYFSFDPSRPSASHPLSAHLHTLSWRQLLTPDQDPTYTEPATVPQSELDTFKASKRSTYHRKYRRWHRCKTVVDSTRAGGFDGLICATTMSAASVLAYLVPLIRGGGSVVWYSPTMEPVQELIDLYSRERRAALIRTLDEWRAAQECRGGPDAEVLRSTTGRADGAAGGKGSSDGAWRSQRLGTGQLPVGFEYDRVDFPVDPRLLLGCAIQSSRIRDWQVLPGRTHPRMMARGGGDGYVFTARRVLPVEGKVEARGKFSKKRKMASV